MERLARNRRIFWQRKKMHYLHVITGFLSMKQLFPIIWQSGRTNSWLKDKCENDNWAIFSMKFKQVHTVAGKR